jgi:hypothetical protein
VADGIQHWEQINKELAATSFSGRAFTKDATQASADAVLAVLATLAFEAAADPTAAWQTYNNPEGFSIHILPLTQKVTSSSAIYGIALGG